MIISAALEPQQKLLWERTVCRSKTEVLLYCFSQLTWAWRRPAAFTHTITGHPVCLKHSIESNSSIRLWTSDLAPHTLNTSKITKWILIMTFVDFGLINSPLVALVWLFPIICCLRSSIWSCQSRISSFASSAAQICQSIMSWHGDNYRSFYKGNCIMRRSVLVWANATESSYFGGHGLFIEEVNTEPEAPALAKFRWIFVWLYTEKSPGKCNPIKI